MKENLYIPKPLEAQEIGPSENYKYRWAIAGGPILIEANHCNPWHKSWAVRGQIAKGKTDTTKYPLTARFRLLNEVGEAEYLLNITIDSGKLGVIQSPNIFCAMFDRPEAKAKDRRKWIIATVEPRVR